MLQDRLYYFANKPSFAFAVYGGLAHTIDYKNKTDDLIKSSALKKGVEDGIGYDAFCIA